jgi:spore cortex formation protein SpoVR/YcgB (stage V sporulation)
MYDRGQLNDSQMLEWLTSHTNVVFQPTYDDPRFTGINPYALGFAIFKDLHRMCTNPTEEDMQWFPNLKGADWKAVIRDAATDYRDDSFISQWLSPKVARDLKLFAITDNPDNSHIRVNAIHDMETFSQLRSLLSEQYDVNAHIPNITVVDADLHGDRSLKLVHRMHNNKKLDHNTDQVLSHIHRLWGYPIRLHSINSQDQIINTHFWSS